jgi:hypothetical protein
MIESQRYGDAVEKKKKQGRSHSRVKREEEMGFRVGGAKQAPRLLSQWIQVNQTKPIDALKVCTI